MVYSYFMYAAKINFDYEGKKAYEMVREKSMGMV